MNGIKFLALNAALSLLSSYSQKTENQKLHLQSITLYTLPETCIGSVFNYTINDVINEVDSTYKKRDFARKYYLNSKDKLRAIDSLINENKVLSNYLYKPQKPKGQINSLDLKYVFKLQFIDSTVLYLGGSRIRKYIVIKNRMYKCDKNFISRLNVHIRVPENLLF